MKHLSPYLRRLSAALLALAVLYSCSDALSDMGLPFQSEPDGRWGLIGVDGEVMFHDEFKADQQPTAAIGDRFFVRGNDGGWVMYATGESAPQTVGKTRYAGVSHFYKDVAILTPIGECVQIVNKDGECIKELAKVGSRELSRITGFDEKGYAIFAVGEDDDIAYGLLNRRGEVVIEPRYCVLSGHGNYYYAIDTTQRPALAEGRKDSVSVSILNVSGKELYSFKLSRYEDFRLFADGFIAYRQEDRGCGLLDIEGAEVMAPDEGVVSIDDIRRGAVIFADAEGHGVMDLQGHVVIRPKYRSLTFATDHLLWAGVKHEGKDVFQLIDLTGQKVGNEAYRDALPFYNGDVAFTKFNTKEYGLIDTNGREFMTTVDVCNVERFTGYRSNWLEPDIIDVDALLKHIDISDRGLGVFHSGMTASEIVTAYRKKDADAPVSLPQNYLYTSRLDYTDGFKGGKFDVVVTTDSYLADSNWDLTTGETSYFWMSSRVSTIDLTLRGDKVMGRTHRIYDALLERISGWGKVQRKERRGASIALGAERGYVVTYDDSCVYITFYNNGDYRHASLNGAEDVDVNEVLPDSVENATIIW